MCEKDAPHLITHVATTPAPHPDEAMVEPIHADLERAQLLPGQHLLDSGYIRAQTLVSSQKEYGVDVIGPTRADYKWQASVFRRIGCESFFHRLASQTSAVPPRTHEQKLDSRFGQSRPRGDQDPLLYQGLSSLSQTDAMYAFAIPGPTS